jgi:hypothetical protein
MGSGSGRSLLDRDLKIAPTWIEAGSRSDFRIAMGLGSARSLSDRDLKIAPTWIEAGSRSDFRIAMGLGVSVRCRIAI